MEALVAMGMCPCPHAPKAGVVGACLAPAPKMSTVLSTWEAGKASLFAFSPVFSHFSCFLPYLPPLSFGQLLSGHT